MSYSMEVEGVVGKARLEDVDASFKDLCAVCDNIRGLGVDEAFELLEKCARGDFPIYYRTHNKKLGHRRELGGRKGRYPQKAVKVVIKVLKSAVASATQKGLRGELFVLHAAANKKMNYPRLAPKGRRRRADFETARVEIIVAPATPAKQQSKDKVQEKNVKPQDAKVEQNREKPEDKSDNKEKKEV